ncbi:MAG: patatin-like phospholipase family protein [Pseudomonadales bacterium]|nr:patatin-like phospholipase family protein [Pseudomonadales bacterium]
MDKNAPVKIGLALGSGSSRGWSHIGVINALIDQGIVPDIVCGTSIGALVGASYVSDNLKNLEQWACALTRFETARFVEINRSLNGFVNTEKLHGFLSQYVSTDDSTIENLAKQYASVATELETGREIWLTEGSILEAVWSSISLPGLFPAIKSNNRWLVDGGLVNPVPVSVCRALGADIVIAVNLNGDIVGKHYQKPVHAPKQDNGFVGKITDFVVEYTASVFPTTESDNQPPGLFDAIAGAVNITQDRITRSRMAGDPPDILLSPKLAHIGLLEFYRAKEAIEEGRQCVQRMLPEIEHVLG